MRFCAVVLLLSLVPGTRPAVSQSRTADSLGQLLRTGASLRPDTVRVRRLLALAQELIIADSPQATRLSQQALVMARQLRDSVGEGQALLGLSVLYRRQNNYQLARRYAQQARRLFLQSDDRKGLGKAWMQLSQIDMLQGNPTPALAAGLKALALTEETGDSQTQTRLQAAIGNIYYRMGRYDEALPMLQAALKNGRRAGDNFLVLTSLNGLGNSFQKLRKWSQALTYYRRALQLSQQLGDMQGETDNETSLAEVYSMQGDQVNALAHGLKARQLVRASQDSYNLPSVELMLAKAYLLAGQTDSALVLAHHGLELSQQTRSNDNIRTASEILAQAYARRRNFAQAYRFRTTQLAYNDTLSGEDTQRRTSALRYSYELDKKQSQIALLTKTRELQVQKAGRQRQQLYGLLGGLAGLVALAALLGRNIFLKQRANRNLNEKNQQIAAHRDELDVTLTELKATQQQLVQSEKLVALAALTAGVAHEIQNPLNFVNNFSEVSLELVDELEEETHHSARDLVLEAELLGNLKQNLVKIHDHGSRADRIIKGMIEHARGGGGQRQAVDLNAMATEYLRLVYHDVQVQHQGFTVACRLELDPELGELCAVPQEIGRVLLNLYTNAFYALWQQAARQGPAYVPELLLSTRRRESQLEVRVRDNGAGIPAGVADKIFEPFYTTKPPGEGTGLGLSLSHDIITQGYGGTLTASSREGEYTEFTMLLPSNRTEQSVPLMG